MDVNGCNGRDQATLINELNLGMQLTKQLQGQMGPEFSSETKQMFLTGIITSFDRALWILGSNGSMEQPQHMVPSIVMPASPVSALGSPQSEDLNEGSNGPQDNGHFSKKRKVPSWTEQVKVSSEVRPEGLPDDGYSWRKYGQKDILGAIYPRSYYRCTYLHTQGCSAKKHVQRSDENPTIFDITYKGKHICKSTPRPKSTPIHPGKQEPKKNHLSIIDYQQPPSDMMLSFQTGLSVDLSNIDSKDLAAAGQYTSTAIGNMKSESQTFPYSPINNHYGYTNFSPSFRSPVTSDSTYFSASPCNMDNFQGLQHHQHFESDTQEIISAATSVANSPTFDLDFPFDQLNFDPSFQFDYPGCSSQPS